MTNHYSQSVLDERRQDANAMRSCESHAVWEVERSESYVVEKHQDEAVAGSTHNHGMKCLQKIRVMCARLVGHKATLFNGR